MTGRWTMNVRSARFASRAERRFWREVFRLSDVPGVGVVSWRRGVVTLQRAVPA